MLKKPENYEEAKLLLKNSANDDLEKSNRKKNIIRAGIITSLSFGAAATVGLVSGRTSTFVAALPLASMISLTSLFPLIYNRKYRKSLESGKAFEGRTEQEVIDVATRYVEEYNNFERNEQNKHR